jgi:phage shock protein A
MIGLLSLILLQGKHGGELVYEYGANSKLVSELDTNLTDAQVQIEELKATIESLNLKNKELNSSLTMAKDVNQTSIVEQNVTVPESNLTVDTNTTAR